MLNILKKAEWKGNVRELRNVIERCSIVCEEQITFEDLPLDLQKRKSDVSPMKDSFELAEIERMHIIKVLQYFDNMHSFDFRQFKTIFHR